MDRATLVALVAGVLQGVFEWLPISSEGNITIFLTAVGTDPKAAVGLSLFLHAGTAVSATVYYRDDLRDVLAELPAWRPREAFAGSEAREAEAERASEKRAASPGAKRPEARKSEALSAKPRDGERATLSFLGVATLASGVVGLAAYATIEAVMSALTGGAFVAVIGLLLVATGVLQRVADGFELGGRDRPDLADALLVGSLQGLAILPGVSRSGTTASALLFRGHDGPSAFRLSFLLSIPAALGAGALVLADGGIPAVPPEAALLALGAAAVVGYLTIDALMRVVERVAFWGVCVGLGALAVLGGVALAA